MHTGLARVLERTRGCKRRISTFDCPHCSMLDPKTTRDLGVKTAMVPALKVEVVFSLTALSQTISKASSFSTSMCMQKVVSSVSLR